MYNMNNNQNPSKEYKPNTNQFCHILRQRVLATLTGRNCQTKSLQRT